MFQREYAVTAQGSTPFGPSFCLPFPETPLPFPSSGAIVEGTQMEKRKTTRIVFHVEAAMDTGGRTIRGKVENLSLSGIFVITSDRLPPGHRVEVFVYLSGSTSQLTVEAKGKVLRSDDRGIAVQFDEIDLDSFIHLRNIVALNEGDMDRIMQEFYQHLNENGFGAGR